jgi:hypothetical protein
VILTIAEIKDLAQFAGLVLTDKCKADTSEDESEIAVEDCPDGGLINTDAARVRRYAHVAYFADYPDEGASGLGPELPPVAGLPCPLCEAGFPLDKTGKLHIPTQSLGMIPVTPCTANNIINGDSNPAGGEEGLA